MRSRLPSITSWMECSYGSQPSLLLDNLPILSCCGVQQGDPLGPLGFALVLHSVIENIKESVPGLLINLWYVDDGTLCGTEQELAIALSIVELEGPPRGLFLNKNQSLIYTPANSSITHPLLRDIPTSSDGFTLLGSPIGPSAFCEETVSKRIRKVHESVARLHDLQDSQLETTLLRSCLALPKLAHVLCTCPPCLIPKALGFFDDIIRPHWKAGTRLVVAEGFSTLLPGWAASFSPCPCCLYQLPPSMSTLGGRNSGADCPAPYPPSLLPPILGQGCWQT